MITKYLKVSDLIISFQFTEDKYKNNSYDQIFIDLTHAATAAVL